ncbi:MAG: hypothetical protein WB524_00350, partial [Acidobacteriaceae bacterium]
MFIAAHRCPKVTLVTLDVATSCIGSFRFLLRHLQRQVPIWYTGGMSMKDQAMPKVEVREGRLAIPV